ncbi:hypothetical protein [Nostoc sp. FACHB-280]|uniref:hypothetical protein n=1 Tax=Nostoc sp. FACHB-280 TaxID=2692839 RepID=UPI00168BB962|nr:hypothetical protein [Nostoc sp. FACHB-280]MBD2496766.1 hypothetical protein [Nostoc sp. FACHB-280]
MMPQATTTEQVTSVEIDFYEHEIYCGQKLIARIIYDHKDLTQPWVVEVNNQEVFRKSWWQKCFDNISWHYKRGTLPLQKEELPIVTTGNEIMAEIAQACEVLGYELCDDGIYHNGKRLKEIVYKKGTYCYVQSLPPQPESPGEGLDLLDKPFDQITREEWLMLAEYEPAQELVAA